MVDASDAEPEGGAATDEDAADARADASESGAGAEIGDDELVRHAAALLFASPDPLSLERLTTLLGVPRERARRALEGLRERLAASGLPLVLEELAGGQRLLTDPALADVVARLAKARRDERITPAALETLAIVAYRQPVTAAEVEAIRGVQSSSMLRTLVERGLVRVVGRADQPGAPLQYGTTREFLDRFGLASLADLPRDAELARGA